MKFLFRQWIGVPREAAFAFFSNPGCLPLLHVEEKHVRVLRHGANVRIGAETWAEVTVFKILPIVLGFKHDLHEPPERFGEALTHGVFSKFTHVHEFVDRDGGTEIRDVLEVKLPWYYGGEAAVRAWVAPGIERSFAIRHRQLERLAKSGELARRAKVNLLEAT